MNTVQINEFLGFVSSLGPVDTRPVSNEGTAITPGASNSMGSYASLGILSTTHDVYEPEIVVHTVSIAGENRMVSIDIAIDPAGGTSFSNIIADLLCGSPAGLQGGSDGSTTFMFPISIPAGATVGIRGASLNATTTAFRGSVRGKTHPTRCDLIRTGSFVQTFGIPTPTDVVGTSITPGTTSDGAWVELGVLDKPLFYFEVGYVVDDTTMTTGLLNVDIALGDATNKRIIISNLQYSTSANEILSKKLGGRYAKGAIGDKIYARSQFTGTPDANNSVAVYGVG